MRAVTKQSSSSRSGLARAKVAVEVLEPKLACWEVAKCSRAGATVSALMKSVLLKAFVDVARAVDMDLAELGLPLYYYHAYIESNIMQSVFDLYQGSSPKHNVNLQQNT